MKRVSQAALCLFLIVSLQAAQKAAARKHSVTRKARHAAQPSFDPNVVNSPNTMDVIQKDSKGSAVLRAQILLDRANFSSGEMDGGFGSNMESSVKAYQASHELNPSGAVDAETWKSLNGDTAPVLVSYTISDSDEAGPFETLPKDLMERAKFKQLNYESPLEEFAERFHAAPHLLQQLNAGKQFDKVGEELMVPSVQRAPIVGDAALVVVHKESHALEVLDAGNKILLHFPASMGSEHDPLPIGEWKLSKPLKNPVFHYNSDLFWDANKDHAKALLAPGPNNPVGVVWIPLSKEHYGIHGTPEPSSIGKTQSHGCIRLTNWDATELEGLVKPGMMASLREE